MASSGFTGAYLGRRALTGAANPANPRGAGFYSVIFGPADLYPDDFEVFHAFLSGPGGNMLPYIDDTPYGAAARGDINEFDPRQAMPVRRGETLSFHWNVGVGPIPLIVLYSRALGI